METSGKKRVMSGSNVKAEDKKKQRIEENPDYVFKNLCTTCNIDMGEMNPRQLCGKTKCLNELINEDYDDNDDDNDNDNDNYDFISIREFEEVVEKEEGKPIKWGELEQKIYKIITTKEQSFTDEKGIARVSLIGVLKDHAGSTIKVWLPSIIVKKLKEKMKESFTTYIRPKGLMESIKSNRKYYDADVVNLKKK